MIINKYNNILIMKLELFIGAIVLLCGANIYFEGKIMNFLKSYQKHYKIAICVVLHSISRSQIAKKK